MLAKPYRKPNWRLIVLVAAAVAILAAMIYAWTYGLPEFSEEEIRRITSENTLLLLLAMLGVMVLQNLLTVIPLMGVITVNVALFGLPGGFAWGWLSSLIGAAAAYAVARYGFRDFAARRMKRNWLERIEQSGHMFVFLARLFPFAPSNLINYAAGIAGIPFKPYIVATAAGNFLFQLIFSMLVEGFMSEGAGQIVSTAVIAVLLAAAIVWQRLGRKRTKR
jgi:uncharacterized membrane protein YdjX (TVP38/TMEM64 family)